MRQTIAFLDKSIGHQIEMDIFYCKISRIHQANVDYNPADQCTLDQARKSNRLVLLRSYYTLSKNQNKVE